jgi:hypothetical protein
LKIPFSSFNNIIITCSYSNLPCIGINFSLKFDISLFGGAYKILAQLLRDFFVNFNLCYQMYTHDPIIHPLHYLEMASKEESFCNHKGLNLNGIGP